MSGIYDQSAAALENATALGQAYDASKTGDSFYLPPEAFSNPEFQRGLKLFLSPDGKAARMTITHDVDPATAEGISYIDEMRHAAQEAVKGTPLAGSKIYIGGVAATFKDIAEMAHYDLIIAGIAALSLIMMFITEAWWPRWSSSVPWRCRWAPPSGYRSWCGSTCSGSRCTGRSCPWR